MKVKLEALKECNNIALISVYDKTSLVDRVQRLVDLGYGILSSGGTAKVLIAAGIDVCDVAELVGGGAILGHKVVTLSREVHAGLLADEYEIDELENVLGLPRIDMVAVDLYPLEEEIANPDCTRESVIAKTDIGGPTMLSSAAKGSRIVITCSEDWEPTLDWMEAGCPNYAETVNLMRTKADGIVANYRLLSARYHSGGKIEGIIGHLVAECQYGENKHQVPAGLYTLDTDYPLAIDRFQQVAGQPASFNNYNDLARLLLAMTRTAAAYDIGYEGDIDKRYYAFVCKHGNLCGAGVTYNNPILALQKMIDGDRRAILGGVVMLNFPLTAELAEILLSYHLMRGEKRRNLDCVAAPAIDDGAIELLKRYKDKCRFLVNPALANLDRNSLYTGLDIRMVPGGFLVQPASRFVLDLSDLAMEQIGRGIWEANKDIILSWAIGSSSCSNSIAIVKDGMLIGLAAAQQDRVTACKVAVMRARAMRHNLMGAIAYSDSFFPFKDGPELLFKAGIRTIFTSSGSINDGDVKQFCIDAGIALYMMPDELCRGFLH